MAKVKFGLMNVFYAKITEADGVVTYGTPVPIPGAVSLTVDPDGDEEVFYADNTKYFISRANNGYTGDLAVALLPETFKTDILGEVKNADGVLVESADDKQSDFALLYQIENDADATKFAYYRCSASRPSGSAATTTATKSPTTDTLSFTAIPRAADRVIKAVADKDSEPYATWFTSVYDPATPVTP